jgi:hypothetical protein
VRSQTGYSGTPLAQKLGVTPHTVIATIDAPKDYAKLVAPLPPGATITSRLPKVPEFVHLFATSRKQLEVYLRRLREKIVPHGVVWVSWPKKAAQVSTDITEDRIRDVALPMGFVDIKVCAVDRTWSGLKLVIRKELRPREPDATPARPRV